MVKLSAPKVIKKSLRSLKFHKKHDRFALNYLKGYVAKDTHRQISSTIKQKKTKVSIVRKGYSFLISGRDLLPVVRSKVLPEDTINKFIEARFFQEKCKEFSDRAWRFIPEYIGPSIVADKRAKKILALSLFAPDTKINFIDTTEASKRLVNHTQLFGKTKVNASRKTNEKYDINITVKPPQLGEFRDLALLASKVTHIRRGDIAFIKEYIEKANSIDVEIPKELSGKFRKKALMELATASAKMDLRSTLHELDIERIRQLRL